MPKLISNLKINFLNIFLCYLFMNIQKFPRFRSCIFRPNNMWIGERGKVNSEFIKNPAIMYPDAGKYAGAPCGLGEGYLDTFKSIFSDVYGWIREGNEMDEKSVPFPTFLTGLCELSIVDAVLKSAETNKWVDGDYQEKGGY